MPYRAPMRGHSLWASILSLIAFAVIILGGILWITSGAGLLTLEQVPDAEELGLLKSQGNAMIVLIEAWNTAHGRYPASLEEACIVVPPADYGGWHYLTDRKGSDFSLSIGPYSTLYPFSLCWLTESQDWYFDD